MSRNNSISFENLLIYTKLYGFDITEEDRDKLQEVARNKNIGPDKLDSYYLKSVSDDYILGLKFTYQDAAPTFFDKTDVLTNHFKKFQTPVYEYSFGYIGFEPDTEFLKTVFDMNADCFYHMSNLSKVKYSKEEVSQELSDYLSARGGGMFSIGYGQKAVAALYKLLGLEYQKIDWAVYGKEKNLRKAPSYVNYIFRVIPLANNRRLAITTQANNWGSEVKFVGFVVTPEDRKYNYVDNERFIAKYGESHRWSTVDTSNVYFADPNPIFPKEINVISREFSRSSGFMVIDNRTLDRAILQDKRVRDKEEAESKARSQIQSRLEKLLEGLKEGKSFTYNDITFSLGQFEYEGQVVSNTEVDLFEVLRDFRLNYREEYFNFDRIFDQFLREVQRGAQRSGGKIGTVDYTIERTESVNSKNVKSKRFYINGIRINGKEVIDALKRALCYDKTKDYTKFLESISRCSLEIHEKLATGIKVKSEDPIRRRGFTFKISLDRENDKNFVVIGEEKISVKNINRLIALSGPGRGYYATRSLGDIIDLLTDEKVLGLNHDQIASLISEGKKSLEEQIKKEKEMLEKTLKLFGVEEKSVTFSGGTMQTGYLVPGKLRQYLVVKDDLRVYEYPSGRYICIVDKGHSTYTSTSRLVNRIHALSNDSKLSKTISTL